MSSTQGHKRSVQGSMLSAAVASGVRLNAYHPTLSTGLCDVRIQDAVLEYPIVRALLVPECDLEARRKCISLMNNVLKAASPLFHAIFKTSQKPSADPPHIQTQKLKEMLASLSPSDPLPAFWIKHHLNYLTPGSAMDQSSPKSPSTASNPPGSPVSDYGHKNFQRPVTTAVLYSRLRKYRDILTDLADRVQGAVCMVFWESWDEIYETVAEIVGDKLIADTESGRIFRPSGNAALYIHRKKVEKQHNEQLRKENNPSMHTEVPISHSNKTSSESSSTSSNSAGEPSIMSPLSVISLESPPSLVMDQLASSNFYHSSNSSFGYDELCEKGRKAATASMRQSKLNMRNELFSMDASNDIPENSFPLIDSSELDDLMGDIYSLNPEPLPTLDSVHKAYQIYKTGSTDSNSKHNASSANGKNSRSGSDSRVRPNLQSEARKRSQSSDQLDLLSEAQDLFSHDDAMSPHDLRKRIRLMEEQDHEGDGSLTILW